jgi:hypothetical protein
VNHEPSGLSDFWAQKPMAMEPITPVTPWTLLTSSASSILQSKQQIG